MMKRLTMALVAFTIALCTMAQDNQDVRRRAPLTPDEVTAKMVESLKLDEGQAAKVKALNQEYAQMFEGPKMGRQGHHHMMKKGDADGCKKGDADCCKKGDGDCCKKGEKKDLNKLSKKDAKDVNKKDFKRDLKKGVPTEEQKESMKAKREERENMRQEYNAKLQQILTEEQYKTYKDSQPKFGKRPGGPRHGGPRGMRK